MYEKFLTNKSIFFHQQTILLFIAYFALRFFSFVLNHHLFTQGLLVFVILLTFGMFCFKNRDIALYILLGEIILGGAGHSFELLGLSIRTLLFITFIILWMIRSMSNNEKELRSFPNKLYFLLALLAVFVAIASFIGLYNGHGLSAVVQDFTPYSFFLLVFPAYYLFNKPNGQKYFIRLLITFVWCSAIFSLFNFVLFSKGISYLQSPYYKWFRDVAMGKITDMDNGFFRIVAPEHFLIVPVIIMLAALLMRREKHHTMWWLMLIPTSLILVLNFSRIYFLAMFTGLLILKYKHSFKRWFFINTAIIASIFTIFISINIIFSHDHFSGINLLIGRAKSISQPDSELSSLTRMSLLRPIFNIMKQHPIIGNGLGSKIIFIEPTKLVLNSTSHFDWGYLEMLVELGVFGFMSFMGLIVYIFHSLITKIQSVSDYHDFYVGALGGMISFSIMNITAPIFFHSLGVIFLVLIVVLISKPHTLLNKIIALLYQTFRRIKI